MISVDRCIFLDWAFSSASNFFTFQYLLEHAGRADSTTTGNLVAAYCAQWKASVSPAAVTDALASAPLPLSLCTLSETIDGSDLRNSKNQFCRMPFSLSRDVVSLRQKPCSITKRPYCPPDHFTGSSWHPGGERASIEDKRVRSSQDDDGANSHIEHDSMPAAIAILEAGDGKDYSRANPRDHCRSLPRHRRRWSIADRDVREFLNELEVAEFWSAQKRNARFCSPDGCEGNHGSPTTLRGGIATNRCCRRISAT